jgi:hypothetical protein
VTTTPLDRPELTVTAWRDYDPAACRLDGMSLGETSVTESSTDSARLLWELGARRVAFPDPVDLTDLADAARTTHVLCLIRELTARAVYVQWQLRLGPQTMPWESLCHLQPPSELLGVPADQDALGTWRRGHYLGKCLWRQGPGFVQIRDRRRGELRRFTAEEPEYQAVIARLSEATPEEAAAGPVLTDLLEEDLVGRVGGYVWMVPYRVRRWTQASMVI